MNQKIVKKLIDCLRHLFELLLQNVDTLLLGVKDARDCRIATATDLAGGC